jgi:hypothetical protein
MIYWILTDQTGKRARRHDGDWEPLSKKEPASDEVERFFRRPDVLARVRKLKAKGIHTKPLRQEGIAFFWHLPAAAGDTNDLAEVIEFRSARQAAAWRKRAEAEGCEVIECKGIARPAKRKRPKLRANASPATKPKARSKRGGQGT